MKKRTQNEIKNTKRFYVPSLKELCLETLNENTKTMIFIHRNSHIGLYWNLIAIEFFRTWPEFNRGIIDQHLIDNLDDSALDIVFLHRDKHPFLYNVVIERLFWETFFR